VTETEGSQPRTLPVTDQSGISGLALQESVPPPHWGRRVLRLWRVVAIVLICVSGLPLMYLYSFLKATRLVSAGRIARLRARGFSLWVSCILPAIGVRVRTRGIVPTGPVLIAPNHQSYMDILALVSRIPSVFLSNDGVRRWPVFGHLTAHLGTLYVDRSRKRMLKFVLPVIEEHLRGGVSVVVFLESTTTDGTGLLPFRSGFLEAAIETETACLPVTIRYSTPCDPWPTSATVCWWGEMTFSPHLWRLLALRRINVDMTIGSPVPTCRTMDRKALSETLRARISGAL